MWTLLTLLAALALPAAAQTQVQLQECVNSLNFTTYPFETETYTFSTTDTSYFDAVFTYDPIACNGVPINTNTIRDNISGQQWACTTGAFGSSGSIRWVCDGSTAGRSPVLTGAVTKRRMAIAARRDRRDDWAFITNIGRRPILATPEYYFYIAGEGPVPSEGVNAKRDWREQLRRNFECPVGQSMCPTGIRGRFECRSTSDDVMSCGACPGAKEVVDCTSIEGAEDIECRAGKCHVLRCEPGWTVSKFNQQCIPDIVMQSRTI